MRVSTHIFGISKEIDGKTFILESKPRHVTPQTLCKNSPLLRDFNTYLWGFQGDRLQKFIESLGMWPLKLLYINKPCSEGFNTHFWGFLIDRWYFQNVHWISSKFGRHVTSQIDCLAKTSPVLRVSTLIYGVSKEIDSITYHFESKPRHVTPQINLTHDHIFGVSKEIDWKMFILLYNFTHRHYLHVIWNYPFQYNLTQLINSWNAKCKYLMMGNTVHFENTTWGYNGGIFLNYISRNYYDKLTASAVQSWKM